MADVAFSTVETFVTTQISNLGGNAAVVIAASVALGLGIFLVFWGLNKIKGGLG